MLLNKFFAITAGLMLLCLVGQSQCDPFFGKLVINEVMASNNSAIADELGEYDDFVEIFNTTDAPISLSGYFLSDDHGTRTKFEFPDMEIQPLEYLIVWCDGQPEQGPLHTSYGISASGEEIGLYDPDTNAVDYVRFGEIPTDITVGRYPDGSGPFARLIPTPGAANTNSIQPKVVINEYMANNTMTAYDQYGAFEDWIEFYNNSPQPVNLQGYFLSDKIGEPTLYSFPDTILEPFSYLIVWADQGLMEPGLHTFFKLGADGDDLIFSDPDTNTIDYVRFGLQFEDVSEGRYPNGTGPFWCPPPSFESDNGTPLSVSDLKAAVSLQLFPNPASTEVKVRTGALGVTQGRILSLSGKAIMAFPVKDEVTSVDISRLPAGMYLVQCGVQVQKLLKINP